ncbi:MAG: ferrous iron transport protein B [Verrucomicrobiales bacterium]|nr:ferrous iron transport protein B [Verrucomicrobiales bacterium]
MTRPETKRRQRVFALVGNPNCGKTTIFNALTGLRQKVGNYPGVTVERKEGTAIDQHGEPVKVIDLPGAYSLDPQSPDEEILRDVLTGKRSDTPVPDAVICVVDASNAERHLYLASQILELGLPTILVLNMTDVAASRKIRLDSEKLSESLGIPVIAMQANARLGLPQLRVAMSRTDLPSSAHKISVDDSLKDLVNDLDGVKATENQTSQDFQDRLIAARYDAIQELVDGSVDRGDPFGETTTDKIDRVLLHPVIGPICLTAVLGVLFYSIFTWAGIPMDFIDSSFGSLADWVKGIMPDGDLRDLITDGVIAGMGGVVIFLPQILILFFFIGIMEDTGYLSRVAFLMDKVMARVGLNGRAFIPILSSYACAVPAIMGTRTIENPKDRWITIMVAPFASCSARLPVYIMLVAILIPGVSGLKKAGFMLGLYLLGTIFIFIFAWIFNRILRKGERTPMIMELPGYKLPSLKAVLHHMFLRSWIFLRRAGTIILGISIILWAAYTYPKSNSDDPSVQQANSIAGRIGKFIEPVIEPLGYERRIGVAVLASFAAREVFVGAMRVSFNIEETESEDETFQLTKDRLASAQRDNGEPLFTPLVCLSLLVFYVFALQCASTVAITKRETNSWKWAAFQFGYMTALAYIAALLVYQGGKLMGYV